MGKILMSGTSGGVASDDVTAKREDIIAGKTAITADSNDEIVEGTLPEHKNTVDAVAVGMASNGTHYNMHCPKGAYRRTDLGENGGAGVIATPLTELRRTIGYTNPAKVLNDTTIAGQTGTIPIQGGSTIVPGTGNKTAIGGGRYASGNIIVSGDPNLAAGNIRSGVTIFGVRGNVQEYKSPANISMAGSIVHSTGGSATYTLTNEGYGHLNIYANGQWWGMARLNNNLPLNLTGWNYINAQLNSNMQYYAIITEVFFGISKNSNLTSLTFDASHYYAQDRLNENEKKVNVKLNTSSLTGNYYLYLAFKITKTVTGTNSKPYVQVMSATLSTQ